MVFRAVEVMRTELIIRFNSGSIKNKVHRSAACVKKLDGFNAVEKTPVSSPSPVDAAGGEEALERESACVQDPDAKRPAAAAVFRIL
jgi:hypothetical protein